MKNFPRWIPEGSRPVTVEGVDAVAYVHERDGSFFAVAYCGKSVKPTFNYRFRTEQNRDVRVAEFFANRKAHQERMAERAASRKAFTHDVKVGDVFYTNWGYDQTNVEFFEVTEVRGKHVIVRELAQEREETGYLSGNCVPRVGHFVGPPLRKLVLGSGREGGSLKMSHWGRYAWRYERKEVVPGVKVGRPIGWSAYA